MFTQQESFVNRVTHVRICVRKIYPQKLAYELSWIAHLVRNASPCQISSKSVEPRPRYGDFSIFQDGGRRHLGFSKFQIFNGRGGKEVELHHLAKFRQNRSNCGSDMAIFRYFKMAAAAILDFRNFKFLTVGAVKRVEMLQHAKFCQNRLNHGRDMAIFWFLQDGGRPPSWICNAYGGRPTKGIWWSLSPVSYTHLTLPTIYSV